MAKGKLSKIKSVCLAFCERAVKDEKNPAQHRAYDNYETFPGADLILKLPPKCTR